jgi:uncharacterized protein
MNGWKIAGIAGTALALGACHAQRPDPRGVAPGETLLQVSGSGKSEARPDEARFSIGVTSVGADAAGAMRANSAKMAAVVAGLKGAGAAEADIQTGQISSARQDWGANKGKFEVTNTVTVRMRKVDQAGAAIAAASQAGANLVSGPDLRVADPEKASRGAYVAAYKAARARADAYADAAGLKIVRVLAIRDGGMPATPLPMGIVADTMVEAAPAPPVLAGTNESNATVSVEFALAPK